MEEGAMPEQEKSFHIGVFRPDDAPGIVRLFRAVYGEHYPVRLFYDPADLTAANADGRCYSIVARAHSGDVIGVTHLFPSTPNKSLYEWGAGLVSKPYRKLGVNNRLAAFLHDEFIPRNPQIEELIGEAVCNHTHLQQACATFRYVETAIEVALMPAEAYSGESGSRERVATLTGVRCYKPKPHRIFLPAPYEKDLRWIYSRLDDTRDIRLSEGKTPAGLASHAEIAIFDFSRVARITVQEIGTAFRPCLEGLEQQARDRNVVVFQVFVNLACPWVGEAVEELRRHGYFFCGALPRWFDDDGFLMQKLLCPPDFAAIVLASDAAKRLLEIVRLDRERTVSGKEIC